MDLFGLTKVNLALEFKQQKIKQEKKMINAG